MSTPAELFLSVLDPAAILYAGASGIAFGASVLLYFSLRYPPKIPMSTRTLVLVTVAASALAGSLFFAGQVVESFTSGDPLWPRALGRAALWEIFSLGIGLGLGVARSFAHSRKDGT